MTGETRVNTIGLSTRIGAREPTNIRERVAEHFTDLRQPVYFYLAQICGSDAEAEELTQETFLRLYRYLHEGHEVKNVRSWVFKVGRNLAVTRIRESMARPSVAMVTADEVPSGESSSEDRLIERERDQRFHRALGALTDRQRQCLHLRAEGLRYREIAEVLSISIDSVSDALERAINNVRKAVHE